MIYNEKATNRWKFVLEGIDDVEYETITRPKISIVSAEQRVELLEMTVTIKDTILNRAAEKVMAFVNRQICDYSTGVNAQLNMLDATGTIIEQWNYSGVRIIEVDFKSLDYVSSNIPRISMKLTYKNVSYVEVTNS